MTEEIGTTRNVQHHYKSRKQNGSSEEQEIPSSFFFENIEQAEQIEYREEGEEPVVIHRRGGQHKKRREKGESLRHDFSGNGVDHEDHSRRNEYHAPAQTLNVDPQQFEKNGSINIAARKVSVGIEIRKRLLTVQCPQGSIGESTFVPDIESVLGEGIKIPDQRQVQ